MRSIQGMISLSHSGEAAVRSLLSTSDQPYLSVLEEEADHRHRKCN